MKILTEASTIWYRGSKGQHLTLGSNSNNTQQYGPGLYFADGEDVAKMHGEVKTYVINTSTGFMTEKSKVRPQTIEFLIKRAPNLEETLQNWGENPRLAFRDAYNGILESSNNMVEALLSVQADFYRDDEELFMEKCIIGSNIHGIIVNVMGGKFLILYNRKKAREVKS